MKPGSVASSDPSAPPGRRGFASRTRTRNPFFASTHAATRPLGPEPITTASGSLCGTRPGIYQGNFPSARVLGTSGSVIVLGIDPGTRHLGWGVVRADGNRIRHVA